MSSLKKWYKKYKLQITFWGLFFGTIITLVLPFVSKHTGIVSIVCLIPLLLFLEFTKDKSSKKQRLFFVWLIGLGIMLGILHWSLQTMPDKWAYIGGWAADVSLFFNYFLFAAVFSLNYLLFAYLYIRFSDALYTKRNLWLIPTFWVVAEAIRSLIFSVAAFGQGGSIGFYWGFGQLGLIIGSTPIGFAGRFVGLYGLSFMAVAINLAILWLIKKKNTWPALMIIGGCTVMAAAGFLLYRPSTQTKTVAYIQTPPNFDGPNAQNKFLKQALENPDKQQNIDILTLPEYAGIFNKSTDREFKDSLQKVLSEKGVIVTSELSDNSVHAANRLYVYNPKLEATYTHDKSFLIPVGEYMPYLHQGILTLMGQSRALSLNRERRQVDKMPSPIPAVHLSTLTIGPQVCSGAVAPMLYQQQVKQGAQVLTNSASLSIFSKAPAYHIQSQQYAHFIAMSNARPFVQGAEGGYGFIINSDGQIVRKSKNLGYDFNTADVKLSSDRTIYTLLGEWVLWLSLGGITILIFSNILKKHK